MPNWRRAHVPGGSFFFTVVTDRRAPIFGETSARRLLGSVIRRCQLRWPMTINALVLLPDHLHAIWSFSAGDDAYSKRWGAGSKRSLRNTGCGVAVARNRNPPDAGAAFIQAIGRAGEAVECWILMTLRTQLGNGAVGHREYCKSNGRHSV